LVGDGLISGATVGVWSRLWGVCGDGLSAVGATLAKGAEDGWDEGVPSAVWLGVVLHAVIASARIPATEAWSKRSNVSRLTERSLFLTG